jgi:hypothetical protein
MNLLSIFGAGPEAVKMAPVIKALEPHPKNETISRFTRLWRVYPPFFWRDLPTSGGLNLEPHRRH